MPLQTRANSVNAPTGPVSSPASSEFEGFLDDDAIPTGSLPLLAPPPTCNTPTESLPRPLAPPPTSNADGSVKSFPSLETAFLYCQTWGRDHGYAIRKCRTKRKGKAPALIYKVYIECECASKKRSTKTPESIHNAIKKDLPHRLLHLNDVWQLLELYLTRTAQQILHKIGYERSKIKDSHRKCVFAPLHYYISHYALDQVLEHCNQFNLFANYESVELPPCTRVFSSTMGLPCAHTVQDRLRNVTPLQINDFHPQWFLDNSAECPPVDPILLLRDPVKIRTRGKDDGKKGKRELIRVEQARNMTTVVVHKEARSQPSRYPREYDTTRSIEDVVRHLPPLPCGLPGFQRVDKTSTVTENTGPEELFPEFFWVDELWFEDIRLAPEVYRLYREIGTTRDRMIRELLYWREDRADAERMREEARRAYRERQAVREAQEAREEATRQGSQGPRRSERGRIPSKRSRDL